MLEWVTVDERDRLARLDERCRGSEKGLYKQGFSLDLDGIRTLALAEGSLVDETLGTPP